MRNYLAILLCLMMILSLGSCHTADKEPNGDNANTNTVTDKKTEDTIRKESQRLISEKQALEIASQYWNTKSGAIDDTTGFRYLIVPIENQSSEGLNYKIALKWLVDNHHYSTVDEIEIDAITGEIYECPFF